VFWVCWWEQEGRAKKTFTRGGAGKKGIRGGWLGNQEGGTAWRAKARPKALGKKTKGNQKPDLLPSDENRDVNHAKKKRE